MVTDANSTIANLIQPPNLAMDVRESSLLLLQRFVQEGHQFAVVTDDGRPVGMIHRAIAEREASEGTLIGQMTLQPLPVVATETMTLGDVMRLGAPADLDRLPVVNAAGMLVGELPRTGLTAIGGMENYEATITAEKLGEEMPVTVKVGEKVIGKDGHDIGTIKDVVTEVTSGRIGYILVEEGLLFKKERKIPVDLIDPTHNDGYVHLKIDKEDVDRLTPLGETR